MLVLCCCKCSSHCYLLLTWWIQVFRYLAAVVLRIRILKHPSGIPYECTVLFIPTGLVVSRSASTIQTQGTSWSLCTTACYQSEAVRDPSFLSFCGIKVIFSAFPSWSRTAKLIELEAKFKIPISSWDCQTYRTTTIWTV